MDSSRSEVNLYRALLYAYPAEFRHEYAAEIERLFADRLASEPRWRIWLETLPDLLLGAVREHAHVLAADLRYASRPFAAAPAFTSLAVLLIAIGIGASSAMFSVVNAVLLRLLPFRDPQQLVYLWSPNTRFTGPNIPDELAPNYADFFDWQKLSHSFSTMATLSQRRLNFIQPSGVRRVDGASVSASFFRTLGVAPVLGRAFRDSEEQPGHEHVAIISYALWQSAFSTREQRKVRSPEFPQWRRRHRAAPTRCLARKRAGGNCAPLNGVSIRFSLRKCAAGQHWCARWSIPSLARFRRCCGCCWRQLSASCL